MTFAQFNLDTNISKAITHCGYTKPTPIQIKSIPEILNGNDLVASAQTGTGKTAAFVLPVLQRLLGTEKTHRKPRVLILSPTRELALQINQSVEKYSRFLSIKIGSVMGGMSYRQQLKKLSQSLDIVVATPGRLLDHLEKRRIDLSSIEMLVIDEADRMLDMGFIDDVSYIAKKTPRARQTLLFSATIDSRLNKVISELLKEPTRIAITNETFAPSKIKQELYVADNDQHKKRLLYHFIQNENIYKAIIFMAMKSSVDSLAAELGEEFSTEALHGDLKQNRRNKIIEDFRNGKIQFLVATDVAARGIDIQDITHVINFDLPKFHEDYIHRIGRTGRAGKSGIAISFVTHKSQRFLQKIEKFINQKLERKIVEGLEPNQNSFREGNPSSDKKRKKFKGKKSFEHKSFSKHKKSYKSAGASSDSKYKKPFKHEGESADSKRRKPFRDETSFSGAKRRKPFREEGSFSDSKRRKPFREESSFSDSKRRKPFSEEVSFSDSKRRKPFREEGSFSDSKRRKSFREESSFSDSKRRKPFREEGSFADSKRRKPFKEESSFADSKRRKPFKQESKPSESKHKRSFKHASGAPGKGKKHHHNGPKKSKDFGHKRAR